MKYIIYRIFSKSRNFINKNYECGYYEPISLFENKNNNFYDKLDE